jgi:hypothetical protein
MKLLNILLTSCIAILFTGITHAQDPVTVGGALMYPGC